MAHLEEVDLNLLPLLRVLLEERHVTRAAERAGLSQPAMSRALTRLRRALDDQLLVRDATGYVLTPKADRLQRQLAGIMPRLETLFAANEFDPSSAEEHYRIAATDYALLLFLPQVAGRINRLSPRSTLRIDAYHDGVFEDMRRGTLDLTFYGDAPPPTLRHELLFEDACVCTMASSHWLADAKRVSLDEYMRCSHLVIDVIKGRQPVIDNHLGRLGLERRVALTLPLFVGAAAALAETDLVATLTRRLVDRHGLDPGVVAIPAPRELEKMGYYLVWHPRLDHDPAQQWLRDTIRSVVAANLEIGFRPPHRADLTPTADRGRRSGSRRSF